MYTTYAEVFRPTQKNPALFYDVLLVLLGTLLLTLSARVAIYVTPSVPLTGQTFAVLLIAALYGSLRGSITIVTYLTQGAMGLPVFAGGQAGFAYMLGPTGGYLLGFVFAAFLVGWLAEHGWDRKVYLTLAAMLMGNIIIYAFGITWFSLVLDFERALTLAVLPFIPGDIIKILVAALLLPSGWALMQRFSLPGLQ